MTKIFRFLAVALWLTSLFVPASAAPNGKHFLGYEIVVNGFMSLLLVFPFSLMFLPFYWLSIGTNVLIAREAGHSLFREYPDWSVGETVAFQTAFLLNTTCAYVLSKDHQFGSMPGLPDLLGYPAPYLWLGAFGILAAAATSTNRKVFSGLAVRLALLTFVAMGIVILSVKFLYSRPNPSIGPTIEIAPTVRTPK